jgi:WD40 repeat protein
MVCDVETGKQEHLTKQFLSKLAFSPGGKYLLGVDISGSFTVWETADLKQTRPLRVERESFRVGGESDGSAAITPDGRTIASTTGSTVVHYWDVPTRSERFATPAAHTEPINSVLFTSDGKTLVTAGGDATARLWDVDSGRQVRVMQHDSAVNVMALGLKGNLLLTGVEFRPWVYLWDLEKQRAPTILSDGLFGASPCAVQSFDEDQTVAMLDVNGGVRRWDVKRQTIKEKISPRLMPAEAPDLEDPDTPDELKAFLKSAPPMASPADLFAQAVFLADGRRSAAIGFQGLRVFDLASAEDRYGHPRVKLFAVSPDGRTLAVAMHGSANKWKQPWHRVQSSDGNGGPITLMESDTGKTIRQFAVSGSELWALAFDRDGKRFAATTGWQTGQIHLFDTTTGRLIRTIATPPIRSSALAFSPDGSLLATGMIDTSVLVFDVRADR